MIAREGLGSGVAQPRWGREDIQRHGLPRPAKPSARAARSSLLVSARSSVASARRSKSADEAVCPLAVASRSWKKRQTEERSNNWLVHSCAQRCPVSRFRRLIQPPCCESEATRTRRGRSDSIRALDSESNSINGRRREPEWTPVSPHRIAEAVRNSATIAGRIRRNQARVTRFHKHAYDHERLRTRKALQQPGKPTDDERNSKFSVEL